MTYRVQASAALAAAVLSGCMPPKQETSPIQPEVVPHGPVVRPPETAPAPRPAPRATTLADYKMQVAKQIAGASQETFAEPLPEVLKSIVVLELAIDRNGHPHQVSVRRSNGIKHLEQRAETSVRRAAPFHAPGPELLAGTREVRFLETFLFRDDGRFQIRSLVEKPQ